MLHLKLHTTPNCRVIQNATCGLIHCCDGKKNYNFRKANKLFGYFIITALEIMWDSRLDEHEAFCNSFAEWCRLAKIHWTFMNKIKGPQLFSLYETYVCGELLFIFLNTQAPHTHTDSLDAHTSEEGPINPVKKNLKFWSVYHPAVGMSIMVKCDNLSSPLMAALV